MKVGDLVRLKAYPEEIGIIVKKFHTSRHDPPFGETWIDVLMRNGVIRAARRPSAYEVMPVAPTL
jgi:hypothetical protein